MSHSIKARNNIYYFINTTSWFGPLGVMFFACRLMTPSIAIVGAGVPEVHEFAALLG